MAERHIVCFGNDLHGDDGFGTRVYARLLETALPSDVEVFNAGIAGLDALRFLENCRQVILVDALINIGETGKVYVLRPDDLPPTFNPTVGHGLGIPYLLKALQTLTASVPDILVVGVEIGELKSFSIGLSHHTERAVPKTVRLLQKFLRQ